MVALNGLALVKGVMGGQCVQMKAMRFRGVRKRFWSSLEGSNAIQRVPTVVQMVFLAIQESIQLYFSCVSSQFGLS